MSVRKEGYSHVLKAALAAPHVTPSPWRQSYADDGRADADLEALTLAGRHPAFSQSPDNIRLIVLLRNAAPEIVAVLEAAHAARGATDEMWCGKVPELLDLNAALDALDAKVRND